MNFKSVIAFSLALLFVSTLEAKPKLVASLPEIKWLVSRLVSDDAELISLLKMGEDAHFVDARPSFALQLASADMLFVNGLELEVGWLPKAMTRSGNRRIQLGGVGFCDLSEGVDVAERISGSFDRSQGDVHAAGNPHYLYSPIQMLRAAEAAAKCLERVLPEKKAAVLKRLKNLHEQVMASFNRGKKDLQVHLRGPKVAEYHRDFVYLFRDLGIISQGSIEEIPGVPPSAARLAKVADEFKRSNVKLVIAASHHPISTLEKVKELSGIAFVRVSAQVGATQEYDYLKSFEHIVDQILRELSTRQ